MESVNIGDHVIIDCQENRYWGDGAVVVSHPFDCEIRGIMTQVVAVKLYHRNYGFEAREKWEEIIVVMSLGQLRPDTGKKFEQVRLERKFGEFWIAYFLVDKIDFQKECAVCHNLVTKRIEINVWGCIHQYDVCSGCAKKYDGIRTDGLPLKVSKKITA